MTNNRVILVHVDFPEFEAQQEDLDEFKELAKSAGAEIVALVTHRRQEPSAKYFIGSGKAEEIKLLVQAENIELVIFNHNLTPAQERNLERLFQCRVLDRTGLILDIFARRARSFEGRLQVELAQLEHLATRLVRGWTHLERQRGGIGLRGPGETQLEVDRRLIRNRIKTIKKRLEKVHKQRQLGRKARKKAEQLTVSLVGYTNTGKSTLFNYLTKSQVYSENKLFATLDPTLRRLELPDFGQIILVDTVGFIRHLPHDLVAAFHATLEETKEADLLLHVVDVSDEANRAKIQAVNQVLEEIGARDLPQLLVRNKIDLKENLSPKIEYNQQKIPIAVSLSAVTGAGVDLLLQALQQLLQKESVVKRFVLKPQDAKLRAELYRTGKIISEKPTKTGGWIITVRLPY